MLRDFDNIGPDGPFRIALYERFSTDLQNDLSIADQDFQMRREIARHGWVVAEDSVRSDFAKSGQTIYGRNGLMELVELSKKRPRPFDAVMFSDTSRFGRRVSEVTRLREIFEFNGVFLYFASDRLDSRDAGFEWAFICKAMQDQSYCKALGNKVREVQFARFHAGHVPGGHTYGYRSMPVEDANRRGPHGRPWVMYCKYEIVQEERVVVIRIFEEYAAGRSYAEIARLLNHERVRPPQNPRGRAVPSWSKSSIREIITNPRYKGTFIWGKTTQERDPETGKIRVRHRPESEWVSMERPDLRIIKPDLWDRVQSQRTMKADIAAKAFGGMNRTAAARTYLFSGLLCCGICDRNMVIVANNRPGKARYGCPDHRERGTCTNNLTILQERLEQELIHALGKNLTSPELREQMVHAFTAQLKQRLEKEAQEAHAIVSRRTELRQELSVLEKQINNVIQTIKDIGASSRLSSEVKTLEARMAIVQEQLTRDETPRIPEFSEEQVREFLAKESEDFASVLMTDRFVAREEIRRRVRSHFP
jgi:site-specific DNA recombinase